VIWKEKSLARVKKGSWAQDRAKPRRKVQSPTGAAGVILESKKRHVDVVKNIFLMETIEGSSI